MHLIFIILISNFNLHFIPFPFRNLKVCFTYVYCFVKSIGKRRVSVFVSNSFIFITMFCSKVLMHLFKTRNPFLWNKWSFFLRTRLNGFAWLLSQLLKTNSMLNPCTCLDYTSNHGINVTFSISYLSCFTYKTNIIV